MPPPTPSFPLYPSSPTPPLAMKTVAVFGEQFAIPVPTEQTATYSHMTAREDFTWNQNGVILHLDKLKIIQH